MKKENDKKVRKSIKKKMSKAAGKRWDEIAKILIENPRRTANLGQYLGKKFPWLAAKLVASTSALAFPEVLSYVIGAIG